MAYRIIAWTIVLACTTVSLAVLMAVSGVAGGLAIMDIAKSKGQMTTQGYPADSSSVTASAPSLRIDSADQACDTDADCVDIVTQCGSCECGGVVNVEYVEKYSTLLRDGNLCSPDSLMVLCEYGCGKKPKCLHQRCILDNVYADTAGWQTYRNEEFGFLVQYPPEFTVTPGGGSNYTPSLVTLTDPATGREVSFYYYASVAEELENKWNNLGATTLAELVEKNPMIEKIGPTTLDGAPAMEVIRGGEGAYYTVFAEKDGHLYEIFFSRAYDKSQLTQTELEILSTFRFIDPLPLFDGQPWS